MADSSDHDAGKGAWRRGIAAVVLLAVAIAIFAGVTIASRPDTVAAAMDSGHYEIARRLLEKAAREGDPRAQNTLGNLYYLGLGGSVDQRAAARWYLEAALQNNADAQVNVARHYALGLGLTKDIVRAFAWLRHARSNGKEVAEGHMKLMVGSVSITPSHLQEVRKRFPRVEDLRPEGDPQ